jgi:hypothetical protein
MRQLQEHMHRTDRSMHRTDRSMHRTDREHSSSLIARRLSTA